jgi:YVTN family beta-propeller protein
VLPSGDVGFVSNSRSDDISVVDLQKNVVIAQPPVGRNPVDIDSPHHLAVDVQRRAVYTVLAYPAVAASGPHAAHGSSQRLGYLQKLSLTDLSFQGEVRVDENPGDIVLSEDGRRIVVSHFDLVRARLFDSEPRANLLVADPEKLLPTGSPDPVRIRVCRAPHGVALSRPDGKTAYVACFADDAIAVVDTSNANATPTLVPLGAELTKGDTPRFGPYSVVLSPSGKWLAVGNTESKDVLLFDTATMKPKGPAIPTGGAAFFPTWAQDEKKLYVPTQNPDGIRVVDVDTAAVTAFRGYTKEECEKPHELGFLSDFRALYTVCEGDQQTPSVVRTLDPASLDPLARIPVGVYPDRMVVVKVP